MLTFFVVSEITHQAVGYYRINDIFLRLFFLFLFRHRKDAFVKKNVNK